MVVASLAGVSIAAAAVHVRANVPVETPDRGTTTNTLDAASCPVKSFCVAVGYAATASSIPLVLWTDEGRWGLAPTSAVAGASTTVLDGVSCLSTKFCMAVGYASSASLAVRPLIERWDGDEWTPVKSGDVTIPAQLSAVSCTSPRFCLAVGFQGDTNTLVESWNGTAWRTDASFNEPLVDTALTGVSCVYAKECMATGDYWDPTLETPTALIERWTGTEAVDSTSAVPGVANSGSSLDGVSCVSMGFCLAVGQFLDPVAATPNTLVEAWNGHFWYEVPSADQGGTATGSYLMGVSCSSKTSCVQVGGYEGSYYLQPFALEWNGTSDFIRVASAAPPGAEGGLFQGVACASDRCDSVGWYAKGKLPDRNLVDVGP